MSERPVVVTSFKDMEADERVREVVDKRVDVLAGEFPELTHVEITVEQAGARYLAHGQAEATEALPAADRLLEKLERQLRKLHDKRIFTQRREAQRDPPKKKSTR
jgi:ribosome-associated translation inhibitor RaiA